MSEISQGPGWWIASDGQWYPPESHPDFVASPEAAAGSDDAPASAASAPRSKAPWVLGVVVLLALAAAALVVALVSGGGGSAFAPGSETATIHIRVPSSGQPAFSGSVGGRPLTGTVVNSASASTGSGSGTLSSGVSLFTYQGSLGGTPYVLHMSLSPGTNGSIAQSGSVVFEVAGTYGSEQVTGNAEFALTSPDAQRSLIVPFNGRIGSQIINGTATATQDGNGAFDVTARLSVLGTV